MFHSWPRKVYFRYGEPPREVGYLYAINWSIGLTLFFPLSLACGLLAAAAARSLCSWYRSEHRLRYGFDTLVLDVVRPFLFLLAILSVALSWWEWYHNSYRLNSAPGSPALPTWVIDWAGRAYVEPAVSPPALNSAFTFATYSYQAVAYAGFWVWVPTALVTARFLSGLRGERVRAAPPVVEVVRLLHAAALSGLCILVSLVLTQLQNNYLHVRGPYQSIFEFARQELIADLVADPFATAPARFPGNREASKVVGQVLGLLVACATVAVLVASWFATAATPRWDARDRFRLRRIVGGHLLILALLLLLGGLTLFFFRLAFLFFFGVGIELAAAVVVWFGTRGRESWAPASDQCVTPGAGEPVFVSYSSRNTRERELIAEALREAGFDPWVDETDLPPGRWEDYIVKLIEEHGFRCAIVVVGAQGVNYAQEYEVGILERFGVPLVVVVLPGARAARDACKPLRSHNMFLISQDGSDPARLRDLGRQVRWAIAGRPPTRPAVEVSKCETVGDLSEFFRVPDKLPDPAHLRTPDLNLSLWEMFHRQLNPFFRHADVACFIAQCVQGLCVAVGA